MPDEFNSQLCKEKHDNVNKEFEKLWEASKTHNEILDKEIEKVWKAVRENREGITAMKARMITILVGVVFNLVGVIGILMAVTMGN